MQNEHIKELNQVFFTHFFEFFYKLIKEIDRFRCGSGLSVLLGSWKYFKLWSKLHICFKINLPGQNEQKSFFQVNHQIILGGFFFQKKSLNKMNKKGILYFYSGCWVVDVANETTALNN